MSWQRAVANFNRRARFQGKVPTYVQNISQTVIFETRAAEEAHDYSDTRDSSDALFTSPISPRSLLLSDTSFFKLRADPPEVEEGAEEPVSVASALPRLRER